jgi:hypothetical protein
VTSNTRTPTLGHHPRSGRGIPAHAAQEEEGDKEDRTKKRTRKKKKEKKKKQGRGQRHTGLAI